MEDIEFQNGRKNSLKGILHHPNKDSKQVILLVHGYMDSMEKWPKAIAKPLEEQNVNSFRFDLSGHGKSAGEFEKLGVTEWAQDVESAIELLKAKGFSDVELCGHSLGGLLCLITAWKHPEIKRMLLRAPNPYPYQIWVDRLGESALQEAKEKGSFTYQPNERTTFTMYKHLVEDAEKYNMIEGAERIQATTLIVHGKEDKLVPLKWGEQLVARLPNGTLILVEGANHWLSVDGDFSEGNKVIVEWFS